MNGRHIEFFDSTLRDGLQGEPVTLSVEERLVLFRLIDQTGVDYIETGFPAASPIDFRLTELLSGSGRASKLSVLSRPTERDLDLTAAALGSRDGVNVQLMFTGSEIHLARKRNITEAQHAEEMRRGIGLCRAHGFTDITAGFEDASRGSMDHLKRCIEVSIEEGATTLALPDTMGVFIPEECHEFVATIAGFVQGAAKLSIHVHNDMGLATANSLAAISAGADSFQGTFAGIGERAGNASIEEVACALHHKRDHYHRTFSVQLDKLYPVYAGMVELLGSASSAHKPIFGDHAFATFAGIHIDGMRKDRTTYEYVNPELFGRHWRFLINGNLGRSLVVDRFRALGLPEHLPTITGVLEAIKQSEHPTRYNDDERFLALHDLVRSQLGQAATA